MSSSRRPHISAGPQSDAPTPHASAAIDAVIAAARKQRTTVIHLIEKTDRERVLLRRILERLLKTSTLSQPTSDVPLTTSLSLAVENIRDIGNTADVARYLAVHLEEIPRFIVYADKDFLAGFISRLLDGPHTESE